MEIDLFLVDFFVSVKYKFILSLKGLVDFIYLVGIRFNGLL